MKVITAFLILTFTTVYCVDFNELFEKLNIITEKHNVIMSDIAWRLSINPDDSDLVRLSTQWQHDLIKWQQETCKTMNKFERRWEFNSTQIRQKYLMCRGPKYTVEEVRLICQLSEQLQSNYADVKVCFPTTESIISSNVNMTVKNLTVVDAAISKYLEGLKVFLETFHKLNVSTVFAAKVTVDEDVELMGKVVCSQDENDFQKMVAFSRNEDVLLWTWLVWREKIGPPMKEPYRKLVDLENAAARRNGYSDIGETWREELEIPNLRQECRRLYEDVRPLYTLLHGVVRFYLRREYGDVVPEEGPIPAHLLGSLWSQNWESLADLIIPITIDLDESMTKQNWTVQHMVTRAEDFYQSLGLPPMTEKFWKNSVFVQENNNTRCHGTAADMFVKGDYRILYCSEVTKEDFYVLHHEFGHIQYYMAYEHQPALFRQANAAFHEAIGDTIMYGVLTPQHLHRLGLINDTLLYSTKGMKKDEAVEMNIAEQSNIFNDMKIIFVTKKCIDCASQNVGIPEFDNENFSSETEDTEKNIYVTTDDILLLKQALNKIPQIPFSLLMDEYRWKYFEGGFTGLDMNDGFWQMALKFQGIAPPFKRTRDYFDAGAEYHVADNTPYIRYFLSSFLQHQLFESLCKAAVFGRRDAKEPLPDTITMNRCDIYGSKAAGKILKDIMSRGHSQHWKQILQETIGQDRISSEALVEYYRPLQNLLEKLVRLHKIPIGW